jgi:hypothetical protein
MGKQFTVEELLQFNEMMLGRGMPVQEDGIGYNKADYGACSTYYHGLSHAQLADLAKRLVKYCNTQLGVDKEAMKETAEVLATLDSPENRDAGVSLNITEEGTIISFRYNEEFIEIIKNQPRHLRRYDVDSKSWMVANERLIPTLNELSVAGADVDNALAYASNHELLRAVAIKKVEVLTKEYNDHILLKFNYNQMIVEEIKQTVDKKDREYNTQHKFWAIHKEAFTKLAERLADVVNFKTV